MHGYLSNPAHLFYHQFDLKHGYWCVSVYPPNRYIFAFTISGIGQLQPTRMPQGSHTSGFSFTELMYLALGEIPLNCEGLGAESSLTHGTSPEEPAMAAFYMDDIFSGASTYEAAYYAPDTLLSRFRWIKGDHMLADGLTKPLTGPMFKLIRAAIGVVQIVEADHQR